jgi:UDP-2,3-diacylglucosamine pyrophosphatase LpxH
MWLADLHVGAPTVTTAKLYAMDRFLNTGPAEQYYLLGDVVDRLLQSLWPDRFKPEDVQTVEFYRDILMTNRLARQIDGNHDTAFSWRALLEWRDGPDVVHEPGAWIGLHGHRQDLLWRVAAVLNRLGKRAPRAAIDRREKLLQLTGFYRRMVRLGRRYGVPMVIHGHVHLAGVTEVDGIKLVCLPDWLDHDGGALVEWHDGHMALVDTNHRVMQVVR